MGITVDAFVKQWDLSGLDKFGAVKLFLMFCTGLWAIALAFDCLTSSIFFVPCYYSNATARAFRIGAKIAFIINLISHISDLCKRKGLVGFLANALV